MLISVSFDKEELLYKSDLSFLEFKIVCDFYHSIIDSPYDHILGDKIIKFNEI